MFSIMLTVAKYKCVGWSNQLGCQHTWTRSELYCGQDRAKCPMCGNDYVKLENYEDFAVSGM